MKLELSPQKNKNKPGKQLMKNNKGKPQGAAQGKPQDPKSNVKKSPGNKKVDKTPPAPEKPVVSEDDPVNGPGAFKKFGISDRSIKKLEEKDITYLFPVQYKTYYKVYNGEDVIVQARTGTGKTLSFALPLVEKLEPQLKFPKRGRAPQVLVLAPTRELARQVCEDFETVKDRLNVFCLYGGTPYGPQENAMRNGIDILVGTPGRILDHMERKNLDLSQLKHVVLDEVDQMLDMGFADSVDAIINSAYKVTDEEKKPQTMLFSATLPQWVHNTAKKYMKPNVQRIDLIGQQQLKTSVTVKHMAIKCSYFDRPATIGTVVQVYSGAHGRAMVFCQMKKEADELASSPHIKHESHVLHGDIPQVKREKVLAKFREGKIKVLITTDVASRGLDIPSVDVVIQCNPPKDTDAYIHRSGRTGRAGRSGISICFYKPNELHELTAVERRAGIKFKKVGAPTTEDIIRASAKDAATSLDTIPDDTLEYFKESAKDLIKERGAENALSAALAVISGSTKIVVRSLLSSKEGLVTYLFRANVEIRSVGYVWNTLVKQLGEDIRHKVSNMRFCKDKMGCAFDIPINIEEEVNIKWVDGNYDTLAKATELPELLDDGEGFGGGYRGGYGDRGSFGERGGSRMGGGSRGGGSRGGGARGGMGGGYGQGGGRFSGGNSRFNEGGSRFSNSGSGYMNSMGGQGRHNNFSRDSGSYNNQGYYDAPSRGFERKRKYDDYSNAPSFSRPNKIVKF